MSTFLFLSAAMVVAALLLLAPSVLRRHQQAGEDTRETNINIARERLADLQKEHEKGELSDEEFTQAKQDLEIALAQDLSAGGPRAQSEGSSRATLLLIVLLVPLLVAGVYLKIGAPEHLQIAGPGQPAAPQAPENMPPVEELVVVLEQRLNAEPNNPQGWFLLGRTFMKMGDFDGAVRAYRGLNKTLPDNPTAMISLADALAMQADGQVPDEAMTLLQNTLKIEPRAATAMWLAGRGAAQRGQFEQALSYWQQAYPLLADQPQAQQQLRALMEQAGERGDIAVTAPQAQPTVEAAAATGLTVQVALDPTMFDGLDGNTTVFVYAKATSGPPMPLAVSRSRVADLPLQVTLDDSMAMMPQMKLSSFPRVLVGARVSFSGQAIPQSGDLQSAEVEVASDQAEAVQLVINQQRP